ncbi:MAG: hypothetical protein GY847_25945 [Proteobacteria bacterium]|nr:hypothetical protein [Pseudomonadota bacterium]
MNTPALDFEATSDDICVWKKVFLSSLKGVGTSYNADMLTEQQLICCRCAGVNYDCYLFVVKDEL